MVSAMNRWRTIFLALFVFLMPLSECLAANRLALVIGNASYATDPLVNPINDARAMGQKLRGLGFAVTQVFDLKRDDMGSIVEVFIQSIAPGDTVVFFYAGHGLQIGGRNYLLATDARLRSSYDVRYNSINVGDFLERLDSSRAQVKIVFLDACRNNPFLSKVRGGGQRGLARMGNAPSGTLISFATRPGGVAEDGNNANGLFTEQLLQHIGTPNLPIEFMLKRVAAGTLKKTNGKQEPWIEGSIRGAFYFRPKAQRQESNQAKIAGQSQGEINLQREAWTIAKTANSPEGYRAFLSEFPESTYTKLARISLALLEPAARMRIDPAAKTHKQSEAIKSSRFRVDSSQSGSPKANDQSAVVNGAGNLSLAKLIDVRVNLHTSLGNPNRTKVLTKLRKMGASVTWKARRECEYSSCQGNNIYYNQSTDLTIAKSIRDALSNEFEIHLVPRVAFEKELMLELEN